MRSGHVTLFAADQQTARETVTFVAGQRVGYQKRFTAGLHVNTVKRAPYEVSKAAMRAQGALLDAYHSTADPLNNAQKAAAVTRGLVLPKALGIDRPMAPALAWQHQWRELVKGNPLKKATTMALHGHGINPQMVDHIEHEKAQDTATLTTYLAP